MEYEEKPRYQKQNPLGHASTTGGPGPRIVDQTNWRTQLQTRRLKFDDEAKARFLEIYGVTGRMSDSAYAAGVTLSTVQNHMKNDPEFMGVFLEAKGYYKDRVIEHAQKLMFEGVDEPMLGGKDKDEIIAYKKVYATHLLAMEMKKVDPDYKERQEIEHTAGTGALIAPAGITVEEWIKRADKENETREEPPKFLVKPEI